MFPLLFLLAFPLLFSFFLHCSSLLRRLKKCKQKDSIPSCDSASNLAKSFNVLAVLWPYLFCLQLDERGGVGVAGGDIASKAAVAFAFAAAVAFAL